MKILRMCEQCGKEFYIYASSLKRSNSSGKFCCRKCYNEHQKTLTKEKNNNFNSVLVTCAECGKEFYIIRSKVGMYKNTFCSKECKNNYMHNYIGGNKNCNWKGGYSQYRGDFETVKTKHFKNCFCALCGTKEHIHIHHIIPYRLTQDNSLSNLIPLCAKHHKMVESITVKAIEAGTNYETSKMIINSILRTMQLAHIKAVRENERFTNTSD